MHLRRQFPGLHPTALRSVQEVCDFLETLWNTTTDDTIEFVRSKGGCTLTVPPPGTFRAKITGGTNPYAWTQQQADGNGAYSDIVPTELAGTVSGVGGATATYRPAYEVNGNTAVPPGTLVWLRPAYLEVATTPTQDMQYEFDYCCGEVPANTMMNVSGILNVAGGVLILPNRPPYFNQAYSYNTGAVWVDNSTCSMYYQCGNTTKTVSSLTNNVVPVTKTYNVVTNVACVNNAIVMTTMAFSFNNGLLVSVV